MSRPGACLCPERGDDVTGLMMRLDSCSCHWGRAIRELLSLAYVDQTTAIEGQAQGLLARWTTYAKLFRRDMLIKVWNDRDTEARAAGGRFFARHVAGLFGVSRQQAYEIYNGRQ